MWKDISRLPHFAMIFLVFCVFYLQKSQIATSQQNKPLQGLVGLEDDDDDDERVALASKRFVTFRNVSSLSEPF